MRDVCLGYPIEHLIFLSPENCSTYGLNRSDLDPSCILTARAVCVEIEKVESWLDEHPQFVRGYFIRKATRHMVDSWILFHSVPQDLVQESSWITNTSSGDPVRNTSARELKSRTSLSRSILSKTSNGIPTHLLQLIPTYALPFCDTNGGYSVMTTQQELLVLDEPELIFELVKDIHNDLDLRGLCHKILRNISRYSVFLVKKRKDDSSRYKKYTYVLC
ncbi:phosphodiesterase [Caerostris darwini]|uniref:Phosphodiesterase n=1 Tax=Caerostris darwini TaxID=1538125 RepID=A0AAV4T5H6_9ARAC|nr:phosphodiesterase [Caerostris darwini]